jgi:hypothetical protein
MAEIQDRKTQETYTGRTVETIVRRVWGKQAKVRRGQPSGIDQPCLATVVCPGDFPDNAYSVLATVVIYSE